jgi:hypothetical protein
LITRILALSFHKNTQFLVAFSCLILSSEGSNTFTSLTADVSDFTTTALIGTANILFFVLVIISTVAVIPGLKGEAAGFPFNKSRYDSLSILTFTLKLVT